MTSASETAHWFKSSYSDNRGGACVEGARTGPHAMAVRDSKDTAQGNLTIHTSSWNALTTALKSEH